jgi:hypothetical protein
MTDNQSVVSDGSAADSRIGLVWVSGNRQPAPHHLELIPPADRLGVPRIRALICDKGVKANEGSPI